VSGPDLEDRTAVFDSFARPPLVIHGTEDGFIPSRTRRGPTAAPGCPRFLKGQASRRCGTGRRQPPRRSLLGPKAFGH